SIPVHIHAGGFADCSALPETAAGLGHCLVLLARRYGPRAVIGFHASGWASGRDVDLNTDPMLDVATEGRHVGDFLRSVGASDADVLFVDMIDRDAGCYEAAGPNCGTTRRTNIYWDEANR